MVDGELAIKTRFNGPEDPNFNVPLNGQLFQYPARIELFLQIASQFTLEPRFHINAGLLLSESSRGRKSLWKPLNQSSHGPSG
jgi:hypothetical protein